MQIVDLRQVHSKTLDVLFQEEARHWRDELHWDYRPSIDLIRKFIDSRSLNGFLALDNGRPAGYGFYVLEDHKGLIGGLFVSSDYAQSAITKRNSHRDAGGASCHAAPGTHRGAVDALRNRIRSGVPFEGDASSHAAIHASAACGREGERKATVDPPFAWSRGVTVRSIPQQN